MDETIRKNTRLKNWDYSNTAWYFVTFCCKDRQKLLGEVVNGDGVPIKDLPPTEWGSMGDCSVLLSAEGKECREVLEASSDLRAGGRVVAYVIMPNHVHLIAAMRRGQSSSSSLGDFIRYIKSSVTKAVRQRKPGMEIWQRGFHDHIIRDDDDLERILEYIATNPAKWAVDRYFE